MIILVCDSSLSGFLCATAEAINMYLNGQDFPGIRSEQEGGTLFETTFNVVRDDERAKRFWKRIEARAGKDAMQTCRDAFLSDTPGKMNACAHGFKRIYSEGKGALDDWSDPLIASLSKAALRSRFQAHLIMGILRFTELSDASLYARIQPECDVLPLIGEHFASRFSRFRFAIHDVGRSMAVVHEPGLGLSFHNGFSLQAHSDNLPQAGFPVSADEVPIRKAWLKYFRAVSIDARKNEKLQISHMPKKYWKFLPEMQFSSAHATISRKGKDDLPWISN